MNQNWDMILYCAFIAASPFLRLSLLSVVFFMAGFKVGVEPEAYSWWAVVCPAMFLAGYYYKWYIGIDDEV